MRPRALVLLLLVWCCCAGAQVVRIGAGPRPALTLGSVSLSASPSNVNIALVGGGVAIASQPISITTGVSGVGVLSSLQLYAYFTSSTALSDSAGDTIPASAVLGMCTTCSSASSYTAFTQTGPNSSASLLLFTDGNLAKLGGSRTDALNLRVDLTAQPQTPAGTYQGTLTLMVQSF